MKFMKTLLCCCLLAASSTLLVGCGNSNGIEEPEDPKPAPAGEQKFNQNDNTALE